MKIKLSKKNPTFVYGWYGECNNCASFDLRTIPSDKLFVVAQIGSTNSSRATFNPRLPIWIPQTFTKLKCGNSYSMTFQIDPQESTIDIPGFVFNNVGGSNQGSITINCNDYVVTPDVPVKLSKNNPTFLSGWYGGCPTCADFDLRSLPSDKLFVVLQIGSKNSSRKSFNPKLPNFIPQTFDKLKCGNSYEFVFHSDSNESTINIPGFIHNVVNGVSKGYITNLCDPRTPTPILAPTPTPTPSPTPTPTPTPSPTPYKTIETKNVILNDNWTELTRYNRLHVKGNYLVCPINYGEDSNIQDETGNAVNLLSLENGIQKIHTGRYDVDTSRCHNSIRLGSSDFDGTYFAVGYINNGIYGASPCGNNNEGGVIVYKKQNNQMIQKQIIFPSPLISGNNGWYAFGFNGVALDGDYLITKAREYKYWNADCRTKFYVYKRTNDAFNLLQTWYHPGYNETAANGDDYGDWGFEGATSDGIKITRILDAENGYLVVGNCAEGDTTGAIFIYKLDKTTEKYSLQQTIYGDGSWNPHQYMGFKGKLNGNILVVTSAKSAGEPSEPINVEGFFPDNDLPLNKGNIYFFELNETNDEFELKTKFMGLEKSALGDVDVKNNVAALGAFPTLNSRSYGSVTPGFVYLFDRNKTTGEWTKRSSTINSEDIKDMSYIPLGSNKTKRRGFGTNVALSDNGRVLYVSAVEDFNDNGAGPEVTRIFEIGI